MGGLESMGMLEVCTGQDPEDRKTPDKKMNPAMRERGGALDNFTAPPADIFLSPMFLPSLPWPGKNSQRATS